MTKQEIAEEIIKWVAKQAPDTPDPERAWGEISGIHAALDWLDQHGLLKG